MSSSRRKKREDPLADISTSVNSNLTPRKYLKLESQSVSISKPKNLRYSAEPSTTGSPHFMSPTTASAAARSAPSSRTLDSPHPQPSNSKAITTQPSKTSGWKDRLGIGKATVKPATSKTLTMGITFPDKYTDATPKNKNGLSLAAMYANKNLPTPPKSSTNEALESRSLIDASERPLQRADSPNKEWPSLSPLKSKGTSTMRIVQDEVAIAQPKFTPAERYPSLVSPNFSQVRSDSPPLGFDSDKDLDSRSIKAVDENSGPVQHTNSNAEGLVATKVDAAITKNQSVASQLTRLPKHDLDHFMSPTPVDIQDDMSAAAAAIEKFEMTRMKLKAVSGPTLSSFPSKESIVASPKSESTNTSFRTATDISSPKEVHAEVSPIPKLDPPPTSGKGSRRGRFPVVATSASKAQPQVIAIKSQQTQISSRRASNPKVRYRVSAAQRADTESEADTAPRRSLSNKGKVNATTFKIFEDQAAVDGDVDSDHGGTAKSRKSTDSKQSALDGSQYPERPSMSVESSATPNAVLLGDMAEDPDGFTSRRLSGHNPDHGALLTISKDAEQFLLGDQPNGHFGSGLSRQPKNPDLRRQAVENQIIRSQLGITKADGEDEDSTEGVLLPKPVFDMTELDPFLETSESKKNQTLETIINDLNKASPKPSPPKASVAEGPTDDNGSSGRANTSNPAPTAKPVTPQSSSSQKSHLPVARKAVRNSTFGAVDSQSGFLRATNTSQARAKVPVSRKVTPDSSSKQAKAFPSRRSPPPPKGTDSAKCTPPPVPQRHPSRLDRQRSESPALNASNTRSQQPYEPIFVGTVPDRSTTDRLLIDLARKERAATTSPSDIRGSKRSSRSSTPSKGLLSMRNLKGLFKKSDLSSLRNSKISEESEPSASSKAVMPTDSSPNSQKDGDRPLSPISLSRGTAVARSLITQAQSTSRPEEERRSLLRMGQVLVDAVTSARDAEQHMESARVAAMRAEMSCLKARKSVHDVLGLVGATRELEQPTRSQRHGQRKKRAPLLDGPEPGRVIEVEKIDVATRAATPTIQEADEAGLAKATGMNDR